MNADESKILLSLHEQGGFKPRFGKDGKREFKKFPGQHDCVKRITLGPDFIKQALKNPEPAYSLKVLKPNQKPKDYYRLSTNMKLHLHVKQYVADYYGLDFGGRIDCFEWELV